MNMTHINYVEWDECVVFNYNFSSENERLFRVSSPKGSRVHRKSGSNKKRCKMDTLILHTTNKKYHMASWFVPFPMTLGDLEEAILLLHDLWNACNSTNICAKFGAVSTDMARRAVPRRGRVPIYSAGRFSARRLSAMRLSALKTIDTVQCKIVNIISAIMLWSKEV